VLQYTSMMLPHPHRRRTTELTPPHAPAPPTDAPSPSPLNLIGSIRHTLRFRLGAPFRHLPELRDRFCVLSNRIGSESVAFVAPPRSSGDTCGRYSTQGCPVTPVHRLARGDRLAPNGVFFLCAISGPHLVGRIFLPLVVRLWTIP
jgi:hypothetical protein